MDERNKTRTRHFPAKENPNMEKALLDWPIVLQYDVKAISRKFFGHEVFSAERSLNQPKATRVCIRSINQSNRFISARLLFLFCSRVFISRSYENRSNDQKIVFMWKTSHFPSFSKTSLKGNSVMGYFFISPLLCNREVAPRHNMVCVFFLFLFVFLSYLAGYSAVTLNTIDHFGVPPGLCFKTRVIWKSFFILMQIKLIFTRKVVHLASFWKWRVLELGSGLSFCQ